MSSWFTSVQVFVPHGTLAVLLFLFYFLQHNFEQYANEHIISEDVVF